MDEQTRQLADDRQGAKGADRLSMDERERTPRPSVGRAVHYVAYGTPGGEFPAGVCRAATITEVDAVTDEDSCCFGKASVGLCVMNPSGLFFNLHVHYDGDTKKPGTWHWQERQ